MGRGGGGDRGSKKNKIKKNPTSLILLSFSSTIALPLPVASCLSRERELHVLVSVKTP